LQEEICFMGEVKQRLKSGICISEGINPYLIHESYRYEFADIVNIYSKNGFDEEWKVVLPDVEFRYKYLKLKWWEFRSFKGYSWEIRVKANTDYLIEVYYQALENGEINLQWMSQKALRKKEKEGTDKIDWINNYKVVLNNVDMDVEVDKIIGYPHSLGKGISKCVQLAKYFDMGLYDPADDYNKDFTLNEVLTISAEDPIAVKECINAEHCGWFYRCFLEGTLHEITEKVKLNKVDGNYYIGGSGNHRICLLKRIKADTIRADVTIWERI